MVSKTKMLDLVKTLRWKDVRSGLAETPALLGFRDERGRGWLHLCCGVKRFKPRDSIKTAEVLLAAGLEINDAAFTEGEFKATPLWYTIAHGRNIALARFLLERGSDPNHCMWAAAYNDDAAAIRLLFRHGAALDPGHEDATPFLFAIQWSRFAAAEQLLRLGADVDFQGRNNLTALHCMLKKGSDKRYFRMLAKYRPRVDIPNRAGATAADVMRRKRDPFFRDLAGQLTR